MKLAIVPISGGMDSLIHLFWAMTKYEKKNIRLVYLDFGHVYSGVEMKIVYNISTFVDIPIQVLDMQWMKSLEDLTTGHIAYRNTLMLLRLAAMYPDRDLDIVFGMLHNESSEDKNPSYIRLMNDLLYSQTRENLYHGATDVGIVTPFANKTKTQMLNWFMWSYTGLEYPDKWRLVRDTVGCYHATLQTKQCGHCTSCYNRWLALTNAGLGEIYREDPWENLMGELRSSILYPSKRKLTVKTTLRQLWIKRKWFLEIYHAWGAVKNCRKDAPNPFTVIQEALKERWRMS